MLSVTYLQKGYFMRELCESERTYTLDGQQLEYAPSITDFGITVCNDMSWSRQK